MNDLYIASAPLVLAPSVGEVERDAAVERTAAGRAGGDGVGVGGDVARHRERSPRCR